MGVKTDVVRARIEQEIKHEAETVLNSIGLTMSDAIRLFVRQVAVRGEFPLELKSKDEHHMV